MHQSLIHLVHFVLRIHLGDRARPGAGAGGLGVIALAGAEFELVEPDQSRLGAVRGRSVDRTAEQVVDVLRYAISGELPG